MYSFKRNPKLKKVGHSHVSSENKNLKEDLKKAYEKLNSVKEISRNNYDRFLSIRKKYRVLREKHKKIHSLGLVRQWNRYLASCFYYTEQCVSVDPTTRYDLCIAHNHNSLVAAFEFSKRNEAPVLYDAVEIPQLKHAAGKAAKKYREDPKGSTLIDIFEKNLIEKTTLICTVSQGLADWLVDNYNIPTPLLLRNCRQYEMLNVQSNIREHCFLGKGDILLLYIGQSYENQGIEQVIASLEKLPDNFHFATLGPGKEDYISELKVLVKKVKVEKRVHFLQSVASTDLISYASGADIGIIPRQNSCLNNAISLPNRLFEMVMARLPVAVACLPDLQKIVRELDNGVTFDQTKPSSIAGSILNLYQRVRDPEALGVLESAAQKLSWENESLTLLEMVEKAVKQRKNGSVAIFAHKNIRSNNRIHRICKTLTEHGHSVVVFARDTPDTDLIVKNVTYFCVDS